MTDPGVNPLVAVRLDATRWDSGLGLMESVADTVSGIESGSWIDSTIGGVATGLDALATVLDPLGSLVSWGVAWLLEHVKPLSDALDWLAGDPDQIGAFAQTWRNVAGSCAEVAADLGAALSAQIAGWGGGSAAAYRAHVGEQMRAMDGIGRAAGGIGSVVQGAGLLVALVRELVRDLIADFVSVLAVRLPMWLAEAGLTFGLATPLVVSQVGSLVAKWAARIAEVVAALIGSLRRLAPMLGRLGDLIDELTALLHRLARTDGTYPKSGDSGSSPSGDATSEFDVVAAHGGHETRPRNLVEYERQEKWAGDAYNDIRANSDAGVIANNLRDSSRADGSTGFSMQEIEQIRHHVFFEEHPLRDYDGSIVHRRYDPSPDMAEAWLRLRRGQHRPEDLTLLEHELAESCYYRDHPGATYEAAHSAANAVADWQNQIPEPTYEDYAEPWR